jgi:hypothetical protein
VSGERGQQGDHGQDGRDGRTGPRGQDASRWRTVGIVLFIALVLAVSLYQSVQASRRADKADRNSYENCLAINGLLADAGEPERDCGPKP